MAFGGGTFTSQNKVLPGSYINFISRAAVTAAAGDRGVAAISLPFDWGGDEIVELTRSDAISNAEKLFGAAYTADAMRPIREILLHATRVLVYRLNGGGNKAANTFATAKYPGPAGNNITIVIKPIPGEEGGEGEDPEIVAYTVETYFGTVRKDSQTVETAADLKSNDFVDFITSATLAETDGTKLTGGTDSEVTAENHTAFLAALEAGGYAPNAVGCATKDSSVKAMYKTWAIEQREEYGMKTQIVAFAYNNANSEAVVNVANSADAVYWVTGVIAGTPVADSATNLIYDGELTIPAAYTQRELADALTAGKFVLHRVGDELRVLDDINSLTTFTDDKGEIFRDNKVIRVIDQIANDTAAIFNAKYLGAVANTASGRTSLWGDVTAILQDLRAMGAIEDFDSEEITVEAGADKNSVVINESVTVAGTMKKLYMTCIIA